MKTLIFLAALLYGCCPKIGTEITVRTDTVMILKDTTIYFPPVVVFDTINLTSFCDSLIKGLAPKVIALNAKTKKQAISLISDEKGNTVIECKSDSLMQVIGVLQTEIRTLEERVTIRLPTMHNFYKYGMMIVSGLFLLTLIIVVVGNKV